MPEDVWRDDDMALVDATSILPMDKNDTELVEYLRGNGLQYDSCSSHKTCDECINSSYTCHFCEFDYQCHAIGSPKGCLRGMSECHHLEDCLRKEPQHVGYGPPTSVVIAVLCLVVTLTCCLCGICSICSVFLRPRRKARSARGMRAGVRSADDHQDQPLLEDIGENDILSFEDDMDNIALERLRGGTDGESRFSWKTTGRRIFWLLLFVTLTVIMLMFYPRMPDYNVCNRQFDWASILLSMRNLHPKIEYQVLMSVINENRFGFIVESGNADIYHNKVKVGTWEMNSTWEAKPGAITDAITPVKLDTTYSEAYSLLQDFRANQLIFTINASITGSITWGKYKLYRISSSVPNIEFLVGAEYDRNLCKCTEYLTPQ